MQNQWKNCLYVHLAEIIIYNIFLLLNFFQVFEAYWIHWLEDPSFSPSLSTYSSQFLKRFYLFIFRERGRQGERKGEKHQCVVASGMPPRWGPGLQARHVPRLGIKSVTFWFTGLCSVHWATPARAQFFLTLKKTLKVKIWKVTSYISRVNFVV